MMKKLVILAAFCLVLVLANTSIAAWGDYDNSSYTAYWDAEKGVWTTDKADIAPYGQCSTCDGHILIYEVSQNGSTMSWENAKGDIIPLHVIEAADTIDNTPYVPEDNSETGTTIGKLKAVQTNPDSAALTLSWESTTADGYVVERKDSANNWKRIALTSDLSYIDNNVVTNTPYEYRVKPYKSSDKGRIYGSYSSVLRVTPKVFSDEAVPSVEWDSEAGVMIRWQEIPGYTGVTYVVKRTDEAGVESILGEDITSLSLTDAGAELGRTYEYAVYGMLGGRPSKPSRTLTVTVTRPDITLDGRALCEKIWPYQATMTSFRTDLKEAKSPIEGSVPVYSDGFGVAVWMDKEGADGYVLRSAAPLKITGSLSKMFGGDYPYGANIGFRKITSIAFDEGFDTSGVTDMSYMFCCCTVLDSLDIKALKTENVADMSYMFSSCCKLTALDISSFKTGNVTDMAHMFRDMQSLTSPLIVSNFNTSRVTDMNHMFMGSVIKSIDLSGFDTGNVTDMQYMFSWCTQLVNVNLSGFKTGNVTAMNDMFEKCESLTDLDLSSFDTSNVTNMNRMFSVTPKLTRLDISGFDTGRVTDMGYMFYNSGMSALDLSHFNTGSVENMERMFYGSKLASVNLSNFENSNLTNMRDMFAYSSLLTSVNMEGFKTDNVTDMCGLFERCPILTSLDLTSFSTAKAKYMNCMFYQCSSLSTVRVSSSFVTSQSDTGAMFYGSPGRLVKV